MRQRALYLLAAILIIAVGLLTRWPAIPLPPVVAKYLGSVLWGAMVYCLLRACCPAARARIVLAAALVLATAVEVSQLWHTTWLDGFRRTTLGVLLIGRYFAMADIVAYGVGIVLAYGSECVVRRVG